jgi:hypothetical protein
MTRWNIRATREGLQRRHGHAQLALARNAIRATTVRLDQAAYHFRELLRRLRGAMLAALHEYHVPGLSDGLRG